MDLKGPTRGRQGYGKWKTEGKENEEEGGEDLHPDKKMKSGAYVDYRSVGLCTGMGLCGVMFASK